MSTTKTETRPAHRWSWVCPGDAARADRAILDALDAERVAQSEMAALDEVEVHVPEMTRSFLQKLMERGSVTLNGAPLRGGTRLKNGDRIEVVIPEPDPLDLTPTPEDDLPLEILFEDDNLVVINKPQNLTVHPSATQRTHTLVHTLMLKIKTLSAVGGELRPGIVHRLDKDTSGALVVSKNDRTHRLLVDIFAAHQIERRYWALCYGDLKLETDPFRFETVIGRKPNDRVKMTIDVPEGKPSKKAISVIHVLERFRGPASLGANGVSATLVEVTLETGRTHQVRVHLHALGHSILGDAVYGTPTAQQPKWRALPADARAILDSTTGQALHARVLAFTHPITGQALRFEAEPPPRYKALLAALREPRGPR